MLVHLGVYRGRLMRNGRCAPEKKKTNRREDKIRHPLIDRKSHYGLQKYAPVTTHHVGSHCSAVLYAGLGGDVGPGQQRAQQGLGLSVQSLRDGAGAQAGQG